MPRKFFCYIQREIMFQIRKLHEYVKCLQKLSIDDDRSFLGNMQSIMYLWNEGSFYTTDIDDKTFFS